MRQLLIVDDDQDFLDLMFMALEARGYGVHTAPKVADAEAALNSTPIDLVITDLGLQDEGGLAFCARLQAERPELPVMVVTGYAEARTAAVAVGARCVLLKPVTVEQLDEALTGI